MGKRSNKTLARKSGRQSDGCCPEVYPSAYYVVEPLFKAAYARYTGIDPDNRSYAMFTRDQQIERYARQCKFLCHVAHVEDLGSLMGSSDKMMLHVMASNLRSVTFAHMNSIFDKETLELIMARANMLPTPEDILLSLIHI